MAEGAEGAARLCRFADVTNDHPVRSGRPYKKYLDTPETVLRTIRYVEADAGKSGLAPQTFDFVTPHREEWSGQRTQ